MIADEAHRSPASYNGMLLSYEVAAQVVHSSTARAIFPCESVTAVDPQPHNPAK
ncbi:MAG: hypothetical protein M3461_12340 [Pseudomonadota bacterium]|nr:hypothetical protein [Pseudomonadota bacterium]